MFGFISAHVGHHEISSEADIIKIYLADLRCRNCRKKNRSEIHVIRKDLSEK